MFSVRLVEGGGLMKGLIMRLLVAVILSSTIARNPASLAAEGDSASVKEHITLATLVASGYERDVYRELLNRFKLNSGIEVRQLAGDDTSFKTEIIQWLRNGKVDVSYSSAGRPICKLAQAKLIQPIDALWREQQWDSRFDARVKEAVTCDDSVYGVPFGLYYWGFFYNKLVFKRLNLNEPRTWDELLTISQILKSHQITPFIFGTEEQWPNGAWFDYLNLRMNGLAFHSRVMQGEESFIQPKIIRVFEYWKLLIDEEYIAKDGYLLNTRQSLPFLLRGQAAMTLSGAYLLNQLNSEQKEIVGFFPFPILSESVAQFEDVPIEAFVISASNNRQEDAEAFLKMIASMTTQTWLSHKLGYLPAATNPNNLQNPSYLSVHSSIYKAQGFSQFFDRDITPQLFQPALDSFAKFSREPDIIETLLNLEKARQRMLSQEASELK